MGKIKETVDDIQELNGRYKTHKKKKNQKTDAFQEIVDLYRDKDSLRSHHSISRKRMDRQFKKAQKEQKKAIKLQKQIDSGKVLFVLPISTMKKTKKEREVARLKEKIDSRRDKIMELNYR